MRTAAIDLQVMKWRDKMDKKSFIRGFGTGVLFVAVILGISCLIRTSDSAVISRARKLGMTFSTSGNRSVLDTNAPGRGS